MHLLLTTYIALSVYVVFTLIADLLTRHNRSVTTRFTQINAIIIIITISSFLLLSIFGWTQRLQLSTLSDIIITIHPIVYIASILLFGLVRTTIRKGKRQIPTLDYFLSLFVFIMSSAIVFSIIIILLTLDEVSTPILYTVIVLLAAPIILYLMLLTPNIIKRLPFARVITVSLIIIVTLITPHIYEGISLIVTIALSTLILLIGKQVITTPKRNISSLLLTLCIIALLAPVVAVLVYTYVLN